MNNAYTKGDVIIITYTQEGALVETTGIVLSTTKSTVAIGYDFRDLVPIGVANIPIEKINAVRKVTPIEICKADDINF